MALSPIFLKESADILALVNELKLELSTRTIYNDSANLVIHELFNETFIIAENLRTILKKNVHSVDAIALEAYGPIKCTESRKTLDYVISGLIKSLVEFQSTWSFSYNTWASSFRSIKNNKDLLIRGEEHMQFEFQILFPNYDKLSRSIDTITREIKYMVDFTLPSISDVVVNNLYTSTTFKQFMYKFFGKNPKLQYTFFNKEKSE